MGRQDFSCIGRGMTEQEALDNAIADARDEYGHQEGYSGAINCYTELHFKCLKKPVRGKRVKVEKTPQKGLIIPPAHSSHCTGRMFGNGLYFSDQSTKALNYSYGYWGGGSSDTNCFMFLADVAMGKAYSPSNRYGSSFPVAGYDSTNVKGGNAGVYNNEMIVYKTNQANLKYLVEFSK